MVQVDVFWAYGLGSGLATAAHKQLKNDPKPFENKYFVNTILFLALIWAPTGLLLLIRHPSWETMQAASSLSSMSEWLILAFGITNVTQGILGYWVAVKFIRQDRLYASVINTLFGYFGMFFILLYGWDGLGYDRFLYDRDMFSGVAWAPGSGLQEGAGIMFLASTAAFTLYLDGVYLLPPLFYLMINWLKEATPSLNRTKYIILFLLAVFVIALGSAAVCALVVHFTGALIGAGDHAMRFYNPQVFEQTMHIFSYIIGLPIAMLILYYLAFKPGRIVHRLVDNLFIRVTSDKALQSGEKQQKLSLSPT